LKNRTGIAFDIKGFLDRANRPHKVNLWRL
jgi:hypothetical protein